ncbi:hypothetical protein ABZY90_19470 [Streptomyces sp. NPDC006422]|uniref:hypothetical protein n=1 Tax=unclassified Streptomyces TaxID=2593676 RepID=UPI0033A1B830
MAPPAEEPIDYQTVRTIARQVEDLVLAETTRTGLDQDAELLTELVRRMVREDYPDHRPATLVVFRSAYRVLESPTNPTRFDSDYLVYTHVKNLGRAAAALADVLNPPAVVRGAVTRGRAPRLHASP